MSFPFFGLRTLRAFVCGSVCWTMASPAFAQTYHVSRETPDFDLWVYTHSTGPTKDSNVVFGAISASTVDNRDGQFFIDYHTSGDVPTNRGASNYQVTQAKLVLTIANSDTVYDPTYDPVSSYDSSGNGSGAADGRPIELYGAGYRYGLTAGTVPSNLSQFKPANETSNVGTRYLYATDFAGGTNINGSSRDVSNNVTINPFDPNPFAIGTVDTTDSSSYNAADRTIEGLTEVTFTLNLANPDVVAYLQQSLNSGFLNFIATSLFSADFMGASGGSPNFYGKLNGDLDAPHLFLNVQVIPEPSAVTLLLCGLGIFVAFCRGARMGERKEKW